MKSWSSDASLFCRIWMRAIYLSRRTLWKYYKRGLTSSWIRCPSPLQRNKYIQARMDDRMETATSVTELLQLFGGSQANMAYYLGLKEALARNPGALCDPRDGDMVRGLDRTQWRPRVRLKAVENLEYLGWEACCVKQTALDDNDDDSECNDDDAVSERQAMEERSSSFTCGVHGCSQAFSSLASYECHYKSSHNCVCSQCKRVFVSDFLLDLHLSENHDSYFNILSTRVDMYRCLVESCPTKFRTPEMRKDHLVVEHKFPASFSFHQPIRDKPSPLKPSKLKSKQQRQTINAMDTQTTHQSSQATHQLTQETHQSTQETHQSAQETHQSAQTTHQSAQETHQLTQETHQSTQETHQSTQETHQSAQETHQSTQAKKRSRRKPRRERMECDDPVDQSQSPDVLEGMAVDNSAPAGTQASPRASAVRANSRGRGMAAGIGFVPRSICFGRGSQRAFRGRRGRGSSRGDTRVNIEEMEFGDLREALQD